MTCLRWKTGVEGANAMAWRSDCGRRGVSNDDGARQHRSAEKAKTSGAGQ